MCIRTHTRAHTCAYVHTHAHTHVTISCQYADVIVWAVCVCGARARTRTNATSADSNILSSIRLLTHSLDHTHTHIHITHMSQHRKEDPLAGHPFLDSLWHMSRICPVYVLYAFLDSMWHMHTTHIGHIRDIFGTYSSI